VMIFAAILIALVGAEMARATFVAWRARRPYFAAGAMGVGMLAIIGVFYSAWLPHVWEIRTSQRIAQMLIDEGATTPGSVIMIGYKEPSLAFYQGGTIREESDPDALALTPPLLWPKWVVMTRRTWDEQTLNVQMRWEIIESLTGWWYASGGKQVEVLVLRKQ
jgi:hypothetical protein